MNNNQFTTDNSNGGNRFTVTSITVTEYAATNPTYEGGVTVSADPTAIDYNASSTLTPTNNRIKKSRQAYKKFELSGTTYYYETDNTTKIDSEPTETSTPLIPTYSWAKSGAGANNATLSSTTGNSNTLTYSTYSTTNTDVTVTVTANYTEGNPRTQTANVSVTLNKVDKCDTPTITFDNSTNKVTITGTSGQTIHYTTTGNNPTSSSTEYTAPFTVTTTTTIKAFATKTDYVDSDISTLEIQKLQTPTTSTNATAQTVTIGNTTQGATYYYTLDGTAPTTAPTTASASTTSTTLTRTDVPSGSTLRVMAVKSGSINSDPSAAQEIKYKLPTPSITFDNATNIATVTCTEPGVSLHYTTNGTTPTSSSPTITGTTGGTTNTEGTISNITTPQEIKVIATKTNYTDSDVKSLNIEKVAKPTIEVSQSLTLSSTTQGAALHYTTDGSTPDLTSPTATTLTEDQVPNGTIINVIATKSGMIHSDITTLTVKYVMLTPSITFNDGKVTISLASGSTKGTIYYTTDGSTPTTLSTAYSAPFDWESNFTMIKAIVAEPGYQNSEVALLLSNKVAKPVISVNPEGEIELDCATNGVTYYYTTDGSAPTTSSASATGSILTSTQVPAGSTLKVIAVKNQMVNSDAATMVVKYPLPVPTITFSTDNTGSTTITTTAGTGTTIYYTTDGTTPTANSTPYSAAFTVGNLDIVKAIAVPSSTDTGHTTSGTASNQFRLTSGQNGNTLIINDWEDIDHWTYYTGVDTEVDGGHYNTTYLGIMYSPDARNITIEYDASQVIDKDGNAIAGATAVAVSATESENKFLYYQTLEKDQTAGNYPYTVIPNPFSKRPNGGDVTVAEVAAASVHVAADGTDTNHSVPANSFEYGGTQQQPYRAAISQYIIPATNLTSLNGRIINKITWYVSSGNGNIPSSNNITVSLKEVDNSTFTTTNFITDLTSVYTGKLTIADSKIEITLTNGFKYNGGNLCIDVRKNGQNDSNNDISFLGVETTNAACTATASQGRNAPAYPTTGTIQNFLPKTTFSSDAVPAYTYTKYYGFGGWKIISGGEYIDGYSNGNVLPLDQEIKFTSTLPNKTAVKFQATWEVATVYEGTAKPGANVFPTTGTYETNFWVLTGAAGSLSDLNQNMTISASYPDGTVKTTDASNQAISVDRNFTGTVKLEYLSYSSSNAINAYGRSLYIGRGFRTTDNTKPNLYASNSGSDNVNQVLRVESGTYQEFYNYHATPNSITSQIVILGCDYDRARNDNDKLEVIGNMFYANTCAVTSNNQLLGTRTYIKSGDFQNPDNFSYSITQNTGLVGGDDAYYYVARNDGEKPNMGRRYLEIQGGELTTIIGASRSHTGSEATIAFTLRMKGGHVRNLIFGGARSQPSNGSRLFIFTGGEINGWITPGTNGTKNDYYGQMDGYAYLYVGGDTRVDSKNHFCGIDANLGVSTTVLCHSIGGNLFGSGCGISSNTGKDADVGSNTMGTNTVVADNAYVERGVYGGGAFAISRETSYIYITGGEIGGIAGGVNRTNNNAYDNTIQGGVYGGSCNNNGNEVKIYMTGGLVKGGIYGGSNSYGTLSGSVTMQINGGQVGTPDSPANIHGGGFGSQTVVNQNVNITLGKTGAAKDSPGVIVYGDVYGGSGLGKTNGTAATNTYSTGVTLNAGYIHGSLYGGALGNSSTAANVYGPVNVTVNGGSVMGQTNAVYGCNNVKGAPQRTVSVIINGTNSAPSSDEYALHAVFGGGNQADYSGTPTVTVNNCDNSIEYVYGGGNAAKVDGTDVTINGGNVIGHVFGGGYGADVNSTTIGTDVKIRGGRILEVYGGNNESGEVKGPIKVQVAETVGTTCPVNVDDLYGGGNKAASAAGAISIGKCTRINRVFGGANQANVTSGDISLKITDGCINHVFGGNNNSGNISGDIEIEVNWGANAQTTNPKASLGNVYGGGNLAAYTGSPTVSLLNCTTTGSVYGGGLGNSAIVTGNPTVTIGDWTSGHKVTIGGSVFGGGALAAVEGNPTLTINDCETLIKGDVYGGGDAAPVYSTKTTIWGGTIEGNVFGGGNGADLTKNPNGAQVGFKSDDVTEEGSGNVELYVYGGTYGKWTTTNGVTTCAANTGGIFGGSNTKGTITGGITFTLDRQSHDGDDDNMCDMHINEVYGAGNKAAFTGRGGLNFTIGCVDGIDYLYGGARDTDFNGDITLTVTSGDFKGVYGGNNLGGNINGKITVNIDETGCKPIKIDNVYGGGNMAAYSAPSGTQDYPQVNIISCTNIGNVYGGGKGATAAVTGNPIVNVFQIPGKYVPGTTTATNSDTNGSRLLGTIGNIYGGGDAAPVNGTTTVNIATQTSDQSHISGTAQMKGYTFPMGANITGNVFGGGNKAEVTGKTSVTIGHQ